MHRVGQVLFIILNKKQQVVPVQVTEQVVRRSLNGEEISYSVAVPGRDDMKSISLEQIDGEVFTSIEEVRAQMFEHASSVIDMISTKAVNVAKNRFDYVPNILDGTDSSMLPGDDVLIKKSTLLHTPEEQLPGTRNTNNDNSVRVDLGDGTVANVKLPQIPGV
jgi:hypothetical protein